MRIRPAGMSIHRKIGELGPLSGNCPGMKNTVQTLIAAACIAATPILYSPAAADPVRYAGGSVWTGTGFETRDLYVEDGRFVEPPTSVELETITIENRYVVPAFGNAHAHRTSPNRRGSEYFLRNGVFYVWNPNTIILDEDARNFFARTDTVDVVTAQGGITEPGGHPERLYVDILGPMIYNNRNRESLLGDAFHYGRNPAEIDASLDLLQSQGATFVKAYLLYSEDYALRRGNPEFYGYRGLNPANLPYLVDAARARGMPVAVHVETAADLVTAAQSGATMAAHLPGHHGRDEGELWLRTALTDEEAQLVAQSGIWIVPTYALLADDEVSVRRMAVARAIQAQNLTLLRRNGARFLMGTDTLGEIHGEAEHLDGLGVFGPGEVLQITLSTGAQLYPDRRIGCFAPGCEADFLVLDRDPTVDIAALRTISMRIKNGRTVGIDE